jgi:hypothetical protein
VVGARRDYAAAASVLIDLDHFVDVAYYRVTGDRDREIIPLHAVELLPFLLVSRSSSARGVGLGIRQSPSVRGLALGVVVHFCIDLVFGDYSLPQLSISWRIAKRMRTGRIGDWAQWPRGTDSWRAMFGNK